MTSTRSEATPFLSMERFSSLASIVVSGLRDNDDNVFLIVPTVGLGEFEQLVLLAIVHLGGETYGVPIADEIERRTGRKVARAAVYVTLRRLEDKGLVSSRMGESTPERGGKGRRHVSLTRDGSRALLEARKVAQVMWRGVTPAALRQR